MMGILRILFSVLLFFPVVGNAFTPTPAQLEAFQNLSPAQQKALARQYGVELPVSGGARAPQALAMPEVVEPRELNERAKGGLGHDARGISNDHNFNDSSELVDADEMKVSDGTELLKPFGYELFAGSPTTFAPATDIPVPTGYVIGPGDTVVVQLYGKENAVHELIVNREGVVQFPEIGPVAVAGQTYQELKTQLLDVVSRQMIGVKASITMGALRSIRIFILGEAFRPGSYTVSSLSTMTNALLVSGGIKEIGSLRRVQLKRSGVLVGELDLYDLLLKGDTSNDKRLQPGDVIFIPSIGPTVGISGEVKRPAIYELKGQQSVGELLALAGGYLPSAFPGASRIERINVQGNRTIVNLDLTVPAGRAKRLKNGDVIQVFSVLDKKEEVVLLSGHVHRPGGFAWHSGLRLSDVVPSYESLLPNPDLSYALIKRETMPERRISVEKVSIGKALAKPKSALDPVLKARDEVLVFGVEEERKALLAATMNRLKSQADFRNPSQVVEVVGNVRFPSEYPYHQGMSVQDLLDAASGISENTDLSYAILVQEHYNKGRVSVREVRLSEASGRNQKLNPKDRLLVFSLLQERQEILQPTLKQLGLQTKKDEELKIVSVGGLVRFPGDYPLTAGMNVESLIQAAGGYRESAYTVGAEVTRSVITEGKAQEFVRVQVDLEKANMVRLVSRDQLYIKRIPNWAERESATISGEVKFPGTYPIFKGDTIVDLIKRAGGLTDYGDVNAAIFLRDDLRKREQQQILKFKAQLEKDLAELKLEAAKDANQKVNAQVVGESMLEQLTDAQATGRLVIDLKRMLEEEATNAVKLKNNDQLVVPRNSTEVSVVGEVQFPTSHLYESGLDVFDYVDVSGGFTSKSDDDRIYVIKPNGKIIAVKNGWFFDRNDSVSPGDTVVVPYDTDAMTPMAYWMGMSQILFQLATTVAALETVGVFN